MRRYKNLEVAVMDQNQTNDCSWHRLRLKLRFADWVFTFFLLLCISATETDEKYRKSGFGFLMNYISKKYQINLASVTGSDRKTSYPHFSLDVLF